MKLTIGVVYPKLLNMYGDKGNITALTKRLKWRNIDVDIKEFDLEDSIDFSDIDIIYIGGGSDKETAISLKALMPKKEELKNYVENNGVLLAVCSGYEMISNEFYLQGEKQEGLGILEITAEPNKKRFVSDVILKTPFGVVAGFENHMGKMDIKDYEPLGEVIFGNGNNGEDKKEGVLYKNTFATYLDGPLLPKNSELCDEIIKRALSKKYDEFDALIKLDDSIELNAKNYIVKKYTSEI